MYIYRVTAKSGKVYEYVRQSFYNNIRWDDVLTSEFKEWYLNPQNTLADIARHFNITKANAMVRARLLGIHINRRKYPIKISK